MKDLIPPIDTPDNLFHDGNPFTGELGTIVTALIMNNLQAAVRSNQNELISAIKTCIPDAVLDESKPNQLITALQKYFLRSGNNLSEIKNAGAPAQNSAKINLALQAFNTSTGANALTTVSSPNGKTFSYLSDEGAWGVQDFAGNPLPLTIEGGGTGANTFQGARVKLSVNAFSSGQNFTSMSSPNANVSIVITDSGDWGVQDGKGNVTPLSVGRGGTGARDEATARTKLGLGNAATKSVGTGLGNIPDMSAFTGSLTGKGHLKFPNGILQWGTINVPAANASVDVAIDQCQIPFPNGIVMCIASGTNTLTDTPCFASAEAISNQQIRIKAVTVNLTNKTITQGQVVSVTWYAIGA